MEEMRGYLNAHHSTPGVEYLITSERTGALTSLNRKRHRMSGATPEGAHGRQRARCPGGNLFLHPKVAYLLKHR